MYDRRRSKHPLHLLAVEVDLVHPQLRIKVFLTQYLVVVVVKGVEEVEEVEEVEVDGVEEEYHALGPEEK